MLLVVSGLAIAHPLSEIESKLSNENISYRLDLFRVMEESVATRGVHDYDHYAFPEELSSEYDADIPPQLKAKIKGTDIPSESTLHQN